jgi:hypothetical protein
VKLSTKQFLALLIVLLTTVSVNQWSTLPIGNTAVNWVLYAIITIVFIIGGKNNYDKTNSERFIYVQLYLLWVVVCIVRGAFVADNYWDYKSLISSGFALLLVASVYIFTNPTIVQYVMQSWLKYALPLFVIFVFFIETQSYGYYLIPISFLALFFPLLKNKWRYLIIIISLFVILVDLDARSNVIKFAFPLLFSLLFYFPKFIHSKWFKLIHISLFVLPFLFLLLAITNTFNVFKMDDYIKGEYTETKLIEGEVQAVNLKADTRTFLYIEVLNSALKNEYILFGRTPARGNDSNYFGSFAAEELGTGRYERYGNEVSILNIFTWLGLVGVVLYFLVFFKAARLAITQSNNTYSKIIGLYVSFRWAYAWVEDFNHFDIMNVMLFITIALCYSSQFRQMTNKEFGFWLNGIFSKKKYFNKVPAF